MTLKTSDPTLEHPLDVFRAAHAMAAGGQRCAFVFVTRTVGGAVRGPGAVVAVSETGVSAGYVSGGCIDSDVVAQAQDAMATGALKTIRYGEGSPFFDITLPCGGAIEVTICPAPAMDVIAATVEALDARRVAAVAIGPDGLMSVANAEDAETGWNDKIFVARYEPRMRLRIAGRGADFIALAQLAIASGIPVELQSPDDACLAAASSTDAIVTRLTTLDALPANSDDRWTAFALMFHDPHWEGTLLKDALGGEAFFIGAVGSPRTQALRREALIELGCSPGNIDRVRGPIGLVPSLRDASMLAVSALAEIVDAFHSRLA